MKIAFESQLLLKGNKTGIGWCADNLIRGLAELPEYECQLNFFSKGAEVEKLKELEVYEKKGVRLNPNGLLKAAWYKLVWPFIPVPYHWFFGSDSQITQFFNYVIPPGVKGKKVTIVHDMAHLACRDTVRLKTKKWLDLTLKASCRRADVVLTISEFSKSEIIKYLHIPESKIQVMYPGVDLNLFHNRYSAEQIERAKGKYGINSEYFLYLGTIEPRKNIQRLIEAYEQLLLRLPEGERNTVPKLVLAGGKGWLCDGIYEAADKKVLENHVIFTGYIDEEDSPLLLSGARIFCFPSLYEGFGIPPVEALACGAPVLAAKAASIPEVLGDHAVYVDPLSVEDISEKLEMMYRDSSLLERMSEEGPKYAERYHWSNSVKRLEEVYGTLLAAERV